MSVESGQISRGGSKTTHPPFRRVVALLYHKYKVLITMFDFELKIEALLSVFNQNDLQTVLHPKRQLVLFIYTNQRSNTFINAT
jgi:hypothetical protein